MFSGDLRTMLIDFLALSVVIFICLPVHELAHGYVAYAFGDDTAKRAGRLTMDPRAHLTPFGVIAFFILGIGWANPVPINSNNFKNRRLGSICSIAAGPLSNFIMGFLFFLLSFLSLSFNELFAAFLSQIAVTNVWLGIFNLLPIPPLDGSQIITSFLPDRLYNRYNRFLSKYSGILVVATLVLFRLGTFTNVVGSLLGKVVNFIAGLALRFIALFII